MIVYYLAQIFAMKFRITDILLAVVAVLVIITVACIEKFTIQNTEKVLGPDGYYYHVHALHDDHDDAVKLMAESNKNVIELLRHMREKYIRGPMGDMYPNRKTVAENLLRRYDVDALVENSPRNPLNDTSFTIQKGKVLALCMREKRDGRNRLHSLELITFVHIHEMSHLAIDEMQHPPKFWQVFKLLLLEAEEAGIIFTPDYRLDPIVYCGLDVGYNPRHDYTMAAYE